jgi:small subunit ribosomal protein S1
MAEESIENKEIKIKMHFRGKVLKTSLAGALVDISMGKPAFLHIARIANDEKSTIKKVNTVLKEGQEIDVWVKRVTKDRVELTMYKPLDFEWRDLQSDMVVKGKVVKFEAFGAFIDIGAERPGLLHVSEMAHEFVKRPQDVIKEGEEIEAKIIAVDRKKKQIKLSMKALVPEPEKEIPQPKLETKPSKKSSPKDKKKEEEVSSEAEDAIPTAMELALRNAMDKAKNKVPKEEVHGKKTKELSHEQQEILARTLEQKALTK